MSVTKRENEMKKHLSRRHLLAAAGAMTVLPAAALAQDTTQQTPAAPDASQTPPPPPPPADATATPAPDATQPPPPPPPPEHGVQISVGTYASEGGQGLYPMGAYVTSDDFHVWPAKDVPNVSWGLTGLQRINYVVNEQADGKIGVYDYSWNKLGEVSSAGDSPCYLSLDASHRWLACANYNTGNIAIFPLDATTGLPGTPVIRQNKGKGKDPDRQAGPHAHWVQFAPGNTRIYHIDLGTDEVMSYTFNETSGKVGDKTRSIKLPSGSGPRHMVFAPDGYHVYIVSELANTVTVATLGNEGVLDKVQSISTLPPDFSGHNQAAHIAINHAGNRLYVSNRGHNSIVVFSINDGKLTPLQTVSTGGEWPRMFMIIEDQYLYGQPRLLVANEHSNNVVPFHIQPDGTLVQVGQVLDVPGPVFIGFEIQS